MKVEFCGTAAEIMAEMTAFMGGKAAPAKKAETAATTAAAAPAANVAPAQQTAPAGPAIPSEEQVRAAVQAKQAEGKVALIKALFVELGSPPPGSKFTLVPKENWATLIARLGAL